MDPLIGQSTETSPPAISTPSSASTAPSNDSVIRLPADNLLGLPTELPKFEGKPPVDPVATPPLGVQTPAPEPVATAPAAVTPPAEDPLDALSKGLSGLLNQLDPAAVKEPAVRGPDPKPPTAVTPANGKRSFDGLEPAEVKLFQQMSNEAYSVLYPARLEQKKLAAAQQEVQAKYDELQTKYNTDIEEAKKARFFEHEDAYKLDPTFQSYVAESSELEDLKAHYTAQLVAVRKNQPWHDAVKNDKGQYVTSEPMQPSVEAEVAISRALQNLAARETHLGALAYQRQQEFKQEFQSVNNSITQFETSLFKPFEKAIAPDRDKFLQRFPSAVRNKPEIRALASSVVVISHLMRDRDQLLARAKAGNLNAGAAATASPSSEQVPSGNGKSSAKTPDQIVAEMNTRLYQGL